MKATELRTLFAEFFKEHGHTHVPSSPLVPPDDPTLLFTTAGMVQFKPLYAGLVKQLPYTRACSVQKCLRAGGKGSDLENVGRTLRHNTFFEMLGNFSFGDYFKREAIQFAWEFSTKAARLDPARLYASVYQDDDEAWDIWTKEIGVPENHMVRLGAKDNFWGPAGETGACGPCSEIYFDRGEQYGPGLTFQYATEKDDDPNTRYIEYWNCVFPQFDQQKDGSRPLLKNRGVDTGMGLERLACISQDARSLFESDLFLPIVECVSQIAGIPDYKAAPIETRQSVNVVADHTRALTFALSEGILPSNEGRGYVLRRLLRRAARYARRIELCEPFMDRVVDAVIDVMSPAYPDLGESVQLLKRVIRAEEEAYDATLGTGLQKLDAMLARAEGDKLSGADVFMLGATYGLPLDDVLEVARDRGVTVDMDEYREHVKRHREESGKGAKGTRFEGIYENLKDLFERHGATHFLGAAAESGNGTETHQYPLLKAGGLKVLAMFKDGEPVSIVREGDNVALVLDRTPFYAESGGQATDTGWLRTAAQAEIAVTDAQKTAEDIWVHYGTVARGTVHEDEVLSAEIDADRRWAIMRNHTATHLLQGALKTVVGRHITQQGSSVGPDSLRFDFSNPEALAAGQIAEVERLVNEQILRNTPLQTRVMDLEKARSTGAIAPFGEKYSTRVRVVEVPEWSMEFCGGTHMPATGGIGLFVITGESAIASGVRRIEAVTGMGAVRTIQQDRAILKSLGERLSVPGDRVPERVEALQEELKAARKQVAQLRSQGASADAAAWLAEALDLGGVRFIAKQVPDGTAQTLRELYDALKSRQPEGLFVVMASVNEGKVVLMAACTQDVPARGLSAGDLIKKIAPIVGGSGGGKKEMAQAGGKDPDKIPDALRAAEEFVLGALKA